MLVIVKTQRRGKNLHKTIDNSKNDHETTKPDMDGSQFGGCLRFGVNPVMEESENELADQTSDDDYADDLMRRIEVLRLETC